MFTAAEDFTITASSPAAVNVGQSASSTITITGAKLGSRRELANGKTSLRGAPRKMGTAQIVPIQNRQAQNKP